VRTKWKAAKYKGKQEEQDEQDKEYYIVVGCGYSCGTVDI